MLVLDYKLLISQWKVILKGTEYIYLFINFQRRSYSCCKL